MKISTILIDDWLYDSHNLCFSLMRYGITRFLPSITIGIEEISEPDIDIDRIYFCVVGLR